MLLLTARDLQPLLGIDVETIKNLMRNQLIVSIQRKELLHTTGTEYLTTPLNVIDFIAENYQIEKNEARQYYISFFHNNQEQKT